jgi:hypothetical protein
MKDIINDINVLIENTGYSINKNDLDIEQLKNINSRLKEVRSKLNLLTMPDVSNTEGKLCDKCYDTGNFYLGTTCPKCSRPFRSVKA